jgi:hypothetical protein
VKYLKYLAITQGIYYLLSGMWPFINFNSFEAITGPKADVWLVKTVGVLIITIGITLLTGRNNISFSLIVLATLTAAGMAAIEINYVLSGTISFIYLGDAILEIFFIIGWISSLIINRKNAIKKV